MRLSLEEFEELTPGMFQALCKRRNVKFKYERFANAQTAAAVYNTSRVSEEQPVVSPFDFVRDADDAAERDRVRQVRKVIMQGIGSLPGRLGRPKILEIRTRLIETLKAHGNADAEDIMNDCWPSLKPKDNEHE